MAESMEEGTLESRIAAIIDAFGRKEITAEFMVKNIERMEELEKQKTAQASFQQQDSQTQQQQIDPIYASAISSGFLPSNTFTKSQSQPSVQPQPTASQPDQLVQSQPSAQTQASVQPVQSQAGAQTQQPAAQTQASVQPNSFQRPVAPAQPAQPQAGAQQPAATSQPAAQPQAGASQPDPSAQSQPAAQPQAGVSQPDPLAQSQPGVQPQAGVSQPDPLAQQNADGLNNLTPEAIRAVALSQMSDDDLRIEYRESTDKLAAEKYTYRSRNATRTVLYSIITIVGIASLAVLDNSYYAPGIFFGLATGFILSVKARQFEKNKKSDKPDKKWNFGKSVQDFINAEKEKKKFENTAADRDQIKEEIRSRQRTNA